VASVVCGTLSGFGATATADEASARDGIAAQLRVYVQGMAASQPGTIAGEDTDRVSASFVSGGFDGDSYAALRAFGRQIAADQPPSIRDQPKLAEADNAFDALREFLQRGNGSAPPQGPQTPPPHRVGPDSDMTSPAPGATLIGSAVCLGCHGAQAEPYSYTLMGRLQKQGKLQCETCHGPGSVHVRSISCAACHGDGGVTRRPGIPSLVGLDPQYLIAAMKEYIAGQRHSPMMKVLLSGMSEAELSGIAFYYARQTPARAQTPPIGDAAAGRSAVGLCAGCHGAEGVSVSPEFPSLAGQDARYLAEAIRDYRDGSRKKIVACAGCHGEGGISKTPGMPSLAGMDAKYLVAAMKAYGAGQRKNAVMKALLANASDAELNNIAAYYAHQTPERAQTPRVGDASAGKAASASCAGCHGEQGVSANPEWPSLAGQDARYLAAALEAYKNGSRSDATMKALVASLDQRTIDNLAGYYASLAPAKPAAPTGAAGRAPVVAANGLLASLDGRTIANIASYYGSLQPARPSIAKNAPGGPVPAVVGRAAPADGRSVGGIISFRQNDPSRSAEANNAICLTCHARGARAYWPGSPHEERDVACTNCHTIMVAVSAQGQLKTPFQPDTCFQCHKDKRAQMFRSSHMPIREGKVVCSDCHNPHGSPYLGSSAAMLKENSINDNCYKCHAEKRGPFLFEHAPVRENCLNCHDPHGSINEYSLKMSRPRLCFECHSIGHGETTGINSNFTMGRACQNCHTMIHGSNSPNGGALQR